MRVEAVAHTPPAPLARGRLGVLLGVIAVFVAASNVGTILSATLVESHPVALLALSPLNRHLLLTVAAGIDPLPYFVVPFLRLVASSIPLFLLGRWYGDRGMRWLERQAGGTPATIRWTEKAFDRAAMPLVFFMPGSNLVRLLAGARGMAARTFLVLLTVGIVVRLIFFWFLGKALQDPLDVVLDWINRYQWWLVGAFLLLTVAQSYRRAAIASKNAPAEEETAG